MANAFRTTVFKLTFFSLMWVVTWLVVEVSCWIFYDQITTPSGRWAVALAESTTFQIFDGVEETVEKPRFLPHPYLLYQGTPGFKTPSGQQHNSLGYRQPEFEIKKGKGTIRILTLGGSTTYGGSVALREESWPMELQKLLKAEFPQKTYEVINGAWDSAATPEILLGWIFRHRHLQPDVVILNIGINDIWPMLLSKSYSSEYVFFRRAQSFNQPNKVLKALIRNSYFTKSLFAFAYREEIDTYPFRQVMDPDIYDEEARDKGVSKRIELTDHLGFKRNFDELIKVIKIEGSKILIVMEPALPAKKIREKIKAKTDPFGWILGLEDAWLLGQKKNYRIMEQIARENRIPFFVMSSDDFKMDWFVDWYHLGPDGERTKARLIKEALVRGQFVVAD